MVFRYLQMVSLNIRKGTVSLNQEMSVAPQKGVPSNFADAEKQLSTKRQHLQDLQTFLAVVQKNPDSFDESEPVMIQQTIGLLAREITETEEKLSNRKRLWEENVTQLEKAIQKREAILTQQEHVLQTFPDLAQRLVEKHCDMDTTLQGIKKELQDV